MKKTIPVILSLAMILTLAFTVIASAAPRWIAIDRCTTNLSFNGSSAYCSVYVNADGAEISAVLKLQKQNLWGSYGTVCTWNLMADDLMDETKVYTPVSSGTYRVVADITAVSSGGTDTASASTELSKP